MNFLTIEDVAQIARTTPQAVRHWRHQGIGPRSFKLGRRVLFDPADVQEWINKHRELAS